MKSIMDPTFVYVPSTSTDIRKTFARIRRENAKAEAAQAKLRPALVTSINRRKA